jgi:hypothetical protein
MSHLQTHVQQANDRLVESDVEAGIQVAVYQGRKLVVDAVVGVADAATCHGRDAEPWREVMSIMMAAGVATVE